MDLADSNRPSVKVCKDKETIYISKNIFVKGKIVGTIICFLDSENVFDKLITEKNQYIMSNNDILFTKSKQKLNDISSSDKYIQIPILSTPFTLLSDIDEKKYNSFFSKWFVFSLAFLAIPILFVLYNLILLNNRNIKLKEEIKNSIKDKQNERIILQQSKVAAIGEMIGNIAHQWRQPLSVITTQATGTKLSLEFEKEITKIQLMETMDNINKQAQYLSKTIDDFRNFFIGNVSDIHHFDIKNTLKNVRNLTKDTFNNNFIEYFDDIKECRLKGNENILIQAFINIYNNSKDALINNSINEKLFFVKTWTENGSLIITIKDNGNGIPKDVIEKVFDPYFTTKHESLGTGIGLYMTNQIITKQFKGSIEVSNKTYSIKDKEYVGAEFIIKLPINIT